MSRKIITVFILLFSLVLHTSASARLYKCVDDHGKIDYGDKPCVNKKRAPLDIVDSGTTSGGSQDRRSVTRSGTNTSSGNADVDSVLRARQAAMNSANSNMNNKLNKAQEDYALKREQDRQRAKKYSNANKSMQNKSFQRNLKKANLEAERKNRMDNTLTQCQRFPNLEKCRTMHPQGHPIVSKAQREEQDKVDQWHKDELQKIDKKYIESTRKDLKAYQ